MVTGTESAPGHPPGRVRVASLRRSPGLVAWLVAVAVFLLALGVRLTVALRGGGLGGVDGYDDGVYYAAASSLVSGRVPYRDFLLLHPPGLMVVLTPFAWLGHLTRDALGFEVARVFSMVVGAANAALILRATRRLGLGAALAGGLTYACWPAAVVSETSIRLEPLVTFVLLLAVALLGTPGRRPGRAAMVGFGVALGVAVSVKIWAAAPAFVLLWWMWRWYGGRALGRAVLGGAVAVAVVDGVFLALAPQQMWRMVVSDQIGRGRVLTDTAARLGRTLVSGVMLPRDWTPSTLTLALAAALGVAVVLACSHTALGRLSLSLLVTTLTVLVLSPTYYVYYAAFSAPFIALTVAAGAAYCSQDHRPLRTHPRDAVRRVLAVGLACAFLLGGIFATAYDSAVVPMQAFPTGPLRGAEAASRCVTSDSPDALILTDVFTRNLERGCRAPVDLSGLTYDTASLPLQPNGTEVPRSRNVRWQRYLHRYLLSGQTIFLMRRMNDGLDPTTLRELRSFPVLEHAQGFAVHTRVSARAQPRQSVG